MSASELASTRHGIVTTGELGEIGIGRRSVHHWSRTGRLRRLYRGVFKLGAGDPSREGRWLAAVKACGPGALLSHLSAAVLWGLLLGDPRVIDVTVTQRRRGHDGIRLHHPRSLEPVDRSERLRIPVTSPERTWFDIAALLGDERAKLALSRGEREGILDPAAMAADPPSRRGVHGRAAARRVLAAYRPEPAGRGFRSGLERAFWEAWLDGGGAEPEVNAYVCGFECDMVWRRARLVVELDGREYHRTGRDRERDRRRERALREGGFRLMRFSDRELGADPARIVALVAAELAAAGSAKR